MSLEVTHCAHINEKRQFQSVQEHCENVAMYAEKEARDIGLGATCKLAGLLHDIGKDQPLFQEYIQKAYDDPKSVRRGEVNHSGAGAKYLYEVLQNDINKKDPVSKLAVQIIAYAVVAHHGLTDCLSHDGKDAYGKRINPEKEIGYKEVVNNCKEYIPPHRVTILFSDAVEEIRSFYEKTVEISERVDEKHKNQNGYYLLGCLQRLVLSLLIDADRRDTAEFMEGNELARLEQEKIDGLWTRYQSKLEDRLSSFHLDTKINCLRKEMADYCLEFAEKGDGIYRLSIPTGGGKTYSGMRYALELAKKTHKKHIFYIAPFLSILEQNAKDIKEVLDDPVHILEHHSNILIESEDEIAEAEELKQYELLSDDWSSPLILTTMVQFLNVLFAGGMQYVRRMHQLKQSVIIIDEAQAIPVKCIHLFTMMMNFLSGCLNSTVIMCTATQPLFEKVDRKLLYSPSPDMIQNAEYYASLFKRVSVVDAMRPKGYDAEQLAEFALEHIKNNLLLICNTKQAVQKLYEAISEQEKGHAHLIQLTTYMCAAHRMDVIEKLKSLLRGGERVICVSTQLIEAGVDISFETVIRSVAGLDSIAQAAGRCNRNAERESGDVYIVNYNEENTGSLQDIYFGQNGTKSVLHHYQGDLLMPEAMEMFYRQYFFDRQQADHSVMDYMVRNENTNLYKLLSYEPKWMNDYRLQHNNDSYPHLLSQAFRTAGHLFSVIDDGQMIGLLVPYDEGKNHLKALIETQDPNEKRRLLRKMQRFTVSVFKNDRILKGLLERQAITDLFGDGTVYCVDDGFYKENGIDDKMELLVF